MSTENAALRDRSTRDSRCVGTALAVVLVVGALAQVLAPVIPFSGIGSRPNESTSNLLITPAGYTFSIWSAIYLLSIAASLSILLQRRTGTALPQRLSIDLIIAFFGAAIWILVSAAEWLWLTPVVLTIMLIALLDAVRISYGRKPADDPGWLNSLTRITVGLYAAWATAATFQNWASDAAKVGADPTTLWWQLAFLIASVVVGLVITWLYGGRLVAYPLGLIWALIGIIVTASGQTTSIVVISVVSIVGIAITYLAALMRDRES